METSIVKKEEIKFINIDEKSNVEDLRKALNVQFNNLQRGIINRNTMKELTNAAGKIINSVALEIEDRNFTRKDVEIPFLQYPNKKAKRLKRLK